jgi:hypothetical protein
MSMNIDYIPIMRSKTLKCTFRKSMALSKVVMLGQNVEVDRRKHSELSLLSVVSRLVAV